MAFPARSMVVFSQTQGLCKLKFAAKNRMVKATRTAIDTVENPIASSFDLPLSKSKKSNRTINPDIAVKAASNKLALIVIELFSA